MCTETATRGNETRPRTPHDPEGRRALRRIEALRSEGAPLLPVKAPRHYRQLVEWEVQQLGHEGGPLYSVIYPRADRFDALAPGEVENFVEDFGHMPPGLERTIVHRYPAKLLYFPTDACVGHCQYCFRPDVTGVDHGLKNRHRNLEPDVVERVTGYLQRHPEVREVIFSGGDPLACKPAVLNEALTRIRSVASVRSVRFHSKAPIFTPALLNDAMLEVLERHAVKLVIHAVHPYELGDELAPRLRDARRRGVMTYNQFPLLRGVNDHPAAIMELAYRCVELGVQMLSMFIADPIRYGATYRLRLARVFAIADEVFQRGEGWISNFRVCLDSPIGKVRREHIVHHDPEKDLYIFERDRGRVTYHDIPEEMDTATPLDDLLYAGARWTDLSVWRR